MDDVDSASKSGQTPPSKKIFLVLTTAGAIIGLLIALPALIFWPSSDVLPMIIAFVGIGTLVGALIAGFIVLVWLVAGKFGTTLAFVTVLIPVSLGVILIVGLSGGFRRPHQVTLIVTGQGEADVNFGVYDDVREHETVTLPWRTTISTKESVWIYASGKTRANGLQCTIEVDGRPHETDQARAGAAEESVRCDFAGDAFLGVR